MMLACRLRDIRHTLGLKSLTFFGPQYGMLNGVSFPRIHALMSFLPAITAIPPPITQSGASLGLVRSHGYFFNCVLDLLNDPSASMSTEKSTRFHAPSLRSCMDVKSLISPPLRDVLLLVDLTSTASRLDSFCFGCEVSELLSRTTSSKTHLSTTGIAFRSDFRDDNSLMDVAFSGSQSRMSPSIVTPYTT